jgi:DNA topoisomerase VI subunit A
MVELGKITKPDAESYAGKRKLYCVANVYSVKDAPDDFKELVDKYWEEIDRQLEKVEAAGKIKKIFCEIILEQGDESFEMLGKINERIPEIIKKKLGEGGVLIPVESEEILGPYTDWSNCLRVVYTHEVFTRVLEFYKEYSEKRLQHILDTIKGNLSEAEAGLLIMKDEDRSRLQFPGDMEVFLITPPSYDDIMKWFRERVLKNNNKK